MAYFRKAGFIIGTGGGGVTPTFEDTLICDNSVLSTGNLTFIDDFSNYDILEFELYNTSTQKITYCLTIPETIAAIMAASSDYVNFNEIANNQYICYGVSNDHLSWTRRGSRNLIIKSVTGYVCDNMTITKTEFYKRNTITPVIASITPAEDVLTYDYLFLASGDGANDQTQPCTAAAIIDKNFNKNTYGFFNRYNSSIMPVYIDNHNITCADAAGDNYFILCAYGLKFS